MIEIQSDIPGHDRLQMLSVNPWVNPGTMACSQPSQLSGIVCKMLASGTNCCSVAVISNSCVITLT